MSAATTPDTPYLLIDEARFQRNLERLSSRITELGSQLRPHLKTLRSVAAARQMLPNKDAPATVSTLAEAEAFAQAGYRDLLYAVGIAPQKLARVAALMEQGVKLHILLDSLAQAEAVIAYQNEHGHQFSVFIEIDCDNHRGGLQPGDASLVEIARLLHQHKVQLTGLMTHAGGSYDCTSTAAIRQMAVQECHAIKQAAMRIRAEQIPCSILSVGSTPTAHYAEDLAGIDEVRAGVYTTFDLVMHNLGVCRLEDIAMSVVTSVIGHNRDKNWLFIDAGWMALSRDRGTAGQVQDYGYGLVCNETGPFPELLRVDAVNQEHGIIELPPTLCPEDFPVGAQLRILPNHACATAAMHQGYVVQKSNGEVTLWDRILGW